MKDEFFQISAKDLGQLALDDFCPRCFWIKRHQKSLPWQIFPGIFNTIDAFTKKIVTAQLDAENRPPWMMQLGEVVKWIKGPHWSKFKVEVSPDVLLTGYIDLAFEMKDGTNHITDFKTAKITDTQDKLAPLYAAQLNGYALIWEKLKMGHISGLSLIYFEPMTEPIESVNPANWHDLGFAMRFRGVVKKVDYDSGLIPRLLKRATEIFHLDKPPEGRKERKDESGKVIPGCEDCEKLDAIMRFFK